MARFHQTLLIPSNQIQVIQDLLQTSHYDSEQGSVIYSGLEARFTNSYRIEVSIVNRHRPTIQASLFDQAGVLVRSLDYEGAIAQDYVFDAGQDTYELSIRTAAATELVESTIRQFNEAHGAFCPYCRSPDLHKAMPQWDGDQIRAHFSCLECEAEWRADYTFYQLNTDPELLVPPTRNVMQNGAHREPAAPRRHRSGT